ncbi:CIC11C00000003924 [Sungouiella intermedia]|uniref:GTP:AMP phosphotransferase, mitochondrial n=1 Tax=Sungouiella intermedia TaxID=45354 RepID=A0A1L0DZ84_9ASCO|nr:CIC11C00000003924 [[Candida] intermedia]
MSLIHPVRLLLLGAPGAGKGTQTSRLLRWFPEINSISSGDTLRSQIAQGTAIGKEASAYIDKGMLVPDETMVGLVQSQLEQRQWLNRTTSWLLDGFPRTAGQATELDNVLGKKHCNLNLVVELDVDQSVILQRIEARWVHPASGRVYNLDYNPPVKPFTDDLTGEPLVKRSDDTAEVFQKRLDQYNAEIEPLKEFYGQKGILHKVSGDTSDIIFPQLKDLVDHMFG